MKDENNPMHSWWWFPNDYRIYLVGVLVVTLVSFFL